MNTSSGIFTTSRNGIYSFAFTAVANYSKGNVEKLVRVQLILNDSEVGSAVTHTEDESVSYYPISLHSTLELKVGDKVWLILQQHVGGGNIHDNHGHYTHFTGHLLQEIKVRSSLDL